MIDHLIFLFYIYFFLFSSIGYGIKFSNIISKNLVNLNLGWYGLIGFFLISLISLFTSFFVSHNFLHNFVLHIIGFIFFCSSFLKNRNYYEYRILIYLSLLLIIAAFVFKNHDDFSYYHLTYALNLSENSFIVGTGNFSHGFRTFSSLFYYHSTLFFPFIDYYLFHIGPFYILVFFNFIIIKKLIENLKSNNQDITFYFSLLSLIFVNIVFYRISEHGTDRSSQILLILIFLLFLKISFIKDNNKILTVLSLITILVTLSASIKAIYYLYFIIPLIVLFKKKLFYELLEKKNFFFFFIIFLSIGLNLITYYLNTGCFLYPAEKTCLIETDWSIPINEVKRMSIHYEWWAKAGGSPGYAHELEKHEYIKNFVWLENWVERHFFNKVSDTLFGTIFICFVVIISFCYSSKKKSKIFINDNKLVYFLILFFFIEWFLNHPSMRYGGFVLIGLPLIIFSSSLIVKYDISKKKVFNLTVFFIILSILIFNLRNIIRINKEIDVYGYKPLESPFFYVDNVESKIITEDKDLKIFNPLNNTCWASKTPCSYKTNLKISNFLWMKMILTK